MIASKTFLKCVAFLAALVSVSTNAFAQSGQVLESLKMNSKILGREVKYTLYLPPDYNTSQRRYPVLYLLHGYTGTDTDWIQFGEANRTADKAIAEGDIPPMIIVMPDGRNDWYANDYQGKNRWEDMFIQEMIPFIDATYRTRAQKEFRALAGLSMGGYGSLHLAAKNPDLFAAVAAFSPAVHTEQEFIEMSAERYNRAFAPVFGPAEGTARISDHWRKYSVLDLMKTIPAEKLKSVRWYIDCGDDDFLYKGNDALHTTMRDQNIPHEYRVREGAHNWTYWRTYLIEGLKFVGQSFRR
ncbi:MAG: alpha/beta hydrolase family protein [Cytophagales bacterium]|nr:esterase family protein [Bernardetiaceae bacterium]MDW8209945.1 alpha/beta hydrolase family protein [Cytophagales bacterium]